MALYIKNPEVEKLAREVAALARETKTQSIRRALEERKASLELRSVRPNRRARLELFLVAEVWSQIPEALIGTRLTRDEEDCVLGYA